MMMGDNVLKKPGIAPDGNFFTMYQRFGKNGKNIRMGILPRYAARYFMVYYLAVNAHKNNKYLNTVSKLIVFMKL